MLFYTGMYGSAEHSLLLWFFIIITLRLSSHLYAWVPVTYSWDNPRMDLYSKMLLKLG